MRIYTLTRLGHSMSRTVPGGGEVTPNWKVLYFIARRGGRATDDQIVRFAGLDENTAHRAMTDLARINPPVVVVGS